MEVNRSARSAVGVGAMAPLWLVSSFLAFAGEASGGLSVAMMSFAVASAPSFPGGLAVAEMSSVSECLAAAAEHSSRRIG